jgi:membrane protein required for colicin V production
MNGVDVAIIIALLLSTALGVYWGLIRQVLSVVGLVAGVVLASRYGVDVADALSSFVRSAIVAQALGFTFVVIAVSSLVGLLATLLHRFIGLLFLGWLDHLTGGLLGLVQAALLCTVLLAIAAVLPNETVIDALDGSRVAPVLVRLFGGVLELMPESFRFSTQMMFEEL